MNETTNKARDREGQSAGQVRHAAGEGSSNAQFKAESALRSAKEAALQNEERARHAGNRANWSK